MSEAHLVAKAPRGAVRRLLGRELRIEARTVAGALAATLVGSLAVAAGPSMVRRAIDDGMRGGDRRALGIAVTVYLVAMCASGVAAGARASLMSRASERFVHRLRTASLAGILRLDLRSFERVRRGDLLARVSADTEALSAATRWVMPEAVRNLTDLLAALVAVALLDPVLALITLVALPPMAAAGRVLRQRSSVVYPRYRAEIGALVGQVTETVEGTDVVQAFGRRDERLGLLRTANRTVTTAYMDGTAMRNRFYASVTLTRVAATAVVMVAASLFAIDGAITVGTAAAGVLAVSTVFGPLAWLTELLDDVLSASAALDRVVATTAIEGPSGTALLPSTGSLVFDGVTFGYDPAMAVLRDVSLDIDPGAHVAIVGVTGAGKTTLARLAAGLTAPDRGTVSFGGVDLAEADPQSRRRRVCSLLQEAFVLTGTIADNMRLLAADADDAALLAAADAVGLGGWVRSHPDGLHRHTGAAGAALSVGERQLIGVLRLAVADPAVVVLDEATAVLDAGTEEMVSVALDRLLAGRTVLVIAHRVETARRCTRVLRVVDGTVVDIDRDELVVYADAADSSASATFDAAQRRLSDDSW